MKRAFYFIFSIIAVAVACNKVENSSSGLTVSCWPTRIMEIDTFENETDTTISEFQYDSLNRLVKYTTFDEIDSFFYEGQTNKVIKRNYYSLSNKLEQFDTYIYDIVGRIIKVTSYEPYSPIGPLPFIYKQNRHARKEQPTLKTSIFDVSFVLARWTEFYYSSLSAKYPSYEKDFKVPNTWKGKGYYKLEANNIVELKGYDIIEGDTIQSQFMTATYDRYNNVYKSLNCGTIVIDKAFSDNNILTQMLRTGTGKDRDSTNTIYKLTYNEYNYPTEIRVNDKVFTTIEYKIDSVGLKKQLEK